MHDAFETAQLLSNLCNEVLINCTVPFPLPIALLTSFGILGALFNNNGTVPKYMDNLLIDHLTHISFQHAEISRKMDSDISELSNLIGNHSFIRDILRKVDLLDELMQDVLREKTPLSRDLFLHECSMNSPESIMKDIISRIKNNTMNPLIKAMEVDEWKTKKTFNLWKNTVDSLLSRLSLLHCFYIGLSSRSRFEANLTYALANLHLFHVKSDLDYFIEHYDSGFWNKTALKVIKHVLANNLDKNKTVKAEMIAQDMSGSYTGWDQFFIIIYPPWNGYEFHTFGGSSESLSFFREYGCNTVVVRSRDAYTLIPSKYKEFTDQKKKLENYHPYSKWYLGKPRGFIRDFDNISEIIEKEGFVGIFSTEKGNEVVIRHTEERAPGMWLQTRASFESNSHSFWPYNETVVILVAYT